MTRNNVLESNIQSYDRLLAFNSPFHKEVDFYQEAILKCLVLQSKSIHRILDLAIS
jgi:hypothetical protein